MIEDRANTKRLLSVYEKRRELLKTIPKFWPVALMNASGFAIHVQHRDDQTAFTHLEDVWVARNPTESRVFTLEFVSSLHSMRILRNTYDYACVFGAQHFSENPYFSDKVLKKEYKFSAPPAAKDEKPDEHGITDSMLDFEWSRDVVPQVCTSPSFFLAELTVVVCVGNQNQLEERRREPH